MKKFPIDLSCLTEEEISQFQGEMEYQLGYVECPFAVSDDAEGRAEKICRVFIIMKEGATFITDLWDLTSFFFVAPAEYEEKQTWKYWKGQNPEILRELRSVLAAIDDF